MQNKTISEIVKREQKERQVIAVAVTIVVAWRNWTQNRFSFSFFFSAKHNLYFHVTFSALVWTLANDLVFLSLSISSPRSTCMHTLNLSLRHGWCELVITNQFKFLNVSRVLFKSCVFVRQAFLILTNRINIHTRFVCVCVCASYECNAFVYIYLCSRTHRFRLKMVLN